MKRKRPIPTFLPAGLLLFRQVGSGMKRSIARQSAKRFDDYLRASRFADELMPKPDDDWERFMRSQRSVAAEGIQ